MEVAGPRGRPSSQPRRPSKTVFSDSDDSPVAPKRLDVGSIPRSPRASPGGSLSPRREDVDSLKAELAKAQQEASKAASRIEELETQLEENEQRWSHQQKSAKWKWEDERDQLEWQLREWAPMQLEDERARIQRVVLLQVDQLHDVLSTQGTQLVEASQHFCEENEALEACIRIKERHLTSELAEVEHLKEQLAKYKPGKGSVTMQVQGSLLQEELRAALAAGRESSQRHAESAHARMRYEEVEMRMKAESEVAEARRTVALVRAEAAAEREGLPVKSSGFKLDLEELRALEKARAEEQERAAIAMSELAEVKRQRNDTGLLRRAVRDAEQERQSLLSTCSCLEARTGVLHTQLSQWQVDHVWLQQLCAEDQHTSELQAACALLPGMRVEILAGKRKGERAKVWRGTDAQGDVLLLMDDSINLELVAAADCRRAVETESVRLLRRGGGSSPAKASLKAASSGTRGEASELTDFTINDAVLRLRRDSGHAAQRLAALNALLADVERRCFDNGRLGYEPLSPCACPAVAAGAEALARASSPRPLPRQVARNPEEAARLSRLARGSAAAVAALLKQVRTLGDERLMVGGEGPAGRSVSVAQLRGARALEKQTCLLERANGWAVGKDPGTNQEYSNGDRSAHNLEGVHFASEDEFGDEESLTAAQRGSALATVLERAAGRLERLQARLSVLSAPSSEAQ